MTVTVDITHDAISPEQVVAATAEAPEPVEQQAQVAQQQRTASVAEDAGDDDAKLLLRLETARQAMGAQQQEMPFAIVRGEALTELPKDLYIPPAALEVFIATFEGPLDLLLYLIKRQNIDILEINVAEITLQYISYIELMDSMRFELAAEYLVMAAMLAEIKSRMLLPRTSIEDGEDEEDPRAQLIRRLQEYERFKMAAEDINQLPRLERELFPASAELPETGIPAPEPDVALKEILLALGEVMHRAEMFTSHHVEREVLSTRERMSMVLGALGGKQFVPFVSLFHVEEGRLGVVVTFLAIMELIKESLVEIVQTEAFGPIHIKAKTS